MSDFYYETLHINNEDLVNDGAKISIPEFMEIKVVPHLSLAGYKAIQLSKYEWRLTKDDANIHLDWNPKDGSYELTIEPRTSGLTITREIVKLTPFLTEKQWRLTYHQFWTNPDEMTLTCVGNPLSIVKVASQLGYCYKVGNMMRLKKLRIFALLTEVDDWTLWPAIVVCHELSKEKIRTIKIRLVMPEESRKRVRSVLESLPDLYILSD